MRKKMLVLALLAALAASVAVGCGGGGGARKESGVEVSEEGRAEEGGSKTVPDPALTVTMNGRSVMDGWFQHWGYEREGSVEKNGCFLEYRELDASELANLPASFASNVRGLPAGSVVFFKFCFADFSGDNLPALKGIIGDVVRTARDGNLRLILGNALPYHEHDSPEGVVTEYEEYNEFLRKTASGNPDVWVYDFYGVLSGPDGYLKPEYDVGDSHLNEAAYSALDETFFPLLDEVFGR